MDDARRRKLGSGRVVSSLESYHEPISDASDDDEMEKTTEPDSKPLVVNNHKSKDGTDVEATHLNTVRTANIADFIVGENRNVPFRKRLMKSSQSQASKAGGESKDNPAHGGSLKQPQHTPLSTQAVQLNIDETKKCHKTTKPKRRKNNSNKQAYDKEKKATQVTRSTANPVGAGTPSKLAKCLTGDVSTDKQRELKEQQTQQPPSMASSVKEQQIQAPQAAPLAYVIQKILSHHPTLATFYAKYVRGLVTESKKKECLGWLAATDLDKLQEGLYLKREIRPNEEGIETGCLGALFVKDERLERAGNSVGNAR